LKLAFRTATDEDAPGIATLVNTSYRGEPSRQGWTTEADLLAGLRTETSEVLKLLAAEHSQFLLCLESTALVGCVCLEKCGDAAHLGMFAVQPQRQGQGAGKQLLAFAEQTAVETWGTKRMVMSVITRREELLAFYQRRGYRRTGVLKPFPAQSRLWTPLVSDLQLELLEKPLQIGSHLYA